MICVLYLRAGGRTHLLDMQKSFVPEARAALILRPAGHIEQDRVSFGRSWASISGVGGDCLSLLVQEPLCRGPQWRREGCPWQEPGHTLL